MPRSKVSKFYDGDDPVIRGRSRRHQPSPDKFLGDDTEVVSNSDEDGMGKRSKKEKRTCSVSPDGTENAAVMASRERRESRIMLQYSTPQPLPVSSLCSEGTLADIDYNRYVLPVCGNVVQ